MGYRYLALVGGVDGEPGGNERALADALEALGMRPQGRTGRLALFAPEETPVLSLSGGNVIVGDLYRRDGGPVASAVDLRHFPAPQALLAHLLEHYWGEYVLLQPTGPDNGDVRLVRDPSGGLACAYSLREGQGFIASDLTDVSRLGLHRDRIDWDFIEHCLVYPRLKIARTGLAGIRELLPGCALSIEGRSVSTATVWSPWTFVAPSERQRDPAAAARMLRDTVTAVVQAMAETDRSLLLELSGGLDSSIVGACLAKTTAHVACCTALTPLPGTDERRYARQIAEQLGVGLLEETLDLGGTEIGFPLPSHSLRPATWALGQAVAQAMDKAAAAQGVHSHFSGSGGDTIFGYLTTAAPAADAFRERGLTAGCHAVANLSRLHGCTITKAARLTLRKLYLSPRPACRADATLLARSHDIPPPLEPHPWFNAPAHALPGDRERIFDLAGNQLFADATVRADGRRVRMPLLSQPVVEACLRVPSWMWIEGGRNRAVARSAFSGLLPQDVLNRRSKGTFMNYTFSAYARNKETVRDFLLDGRLRARGLLNVQAVNLLLDTPRPPRDRSFLRIFDLCMIENWIRNHG
ncbi:asparagine synthase family protein [Xanthomonas citri pv. mangiferaeindicae LMG 941]|uniref:asparagine synthase-related protein n=1 Tax=Xanthomonas citri TaxID=346 RepID=UPI000255297A|nr:asparagine synthetase B family protein [Xanthomonas citri]CCG37615.1 asparagine synthase family protein [Xanthomonas citri pv. mangiferaeindicae LMG 941]